MKRARMGAEVAAQFVAGAVSLVWGLVFAVAAYALLRCVQYFVYPDPNPATLVWSAHSGYLWRASTVAYGGGITAFVAFLVARPHLDRTARTLAPAIVVAVTLLVLQAILLP